MKLLEGVPIGVNLSYETDYRITRELLENSWEEGTKLLIINYPNNPTGRVLHADEFAAIKAFLQEHEDILLLSDEMYERILYDGNTNISPASDPELIDRVITVNGFSKSVAMTGWRAGYLAANRELAGLAGKLFQHTISCVSGFIQKACVVALDCTEEIEEMRSIYQKRRDFFIGALNQIPGVTCKSPEGAFYAWTRFDIPGKTSEEICDFILNEAKVVGVPGDSYGEEGVTTLRFSFAASMESLQKAAENIAAVMKRI